MEKTPAKQQQRRVLCHEFSYVRKINHTKKRMPPPQTEQTNKMVALCLSGGGIRSATFCLGVLQGLNKLNRLDDFDYLSTVSGGGYLGSMINAWLRTQNPNVAPNWNAVLQNDSPALNNLRKTSNYLSPLLGFTFDTFRMIGIFLRNLLINWAVVIPLLLAVTLLPWLWLGICSLSAPFWLIIPPLVLHLLLLAAIIGTLLQPAWDNLYGVMSDSFWKVLHFVSLLALAFCSQPYRDNMATSLHIEWLVQDELKAALFLVPIGLLANALICFLVSAGVALLEWADQDLAAERLSAQVAQLLVFAATWVLLFGIALYGIPRWFDLLCDVEHINRLTSNAIDSLKSNAHLLGQWNDAAGNNTVFAFMKWDSAARIAAASNKIIQKLTQPQIFGVFGLALGILISLCGYFDQRSPAPTNDKSSTMLRRLGSYAFSIIAGCFILILIFGFSWLAAELVSWLIGACPKRISTGSTLVSLSKTWTARAVFEIKNEHVREIGLTIVALLTLSVFFACLAGINRFSLHKFYANRLREAFFRG